jgi:type II secretory pathway pseudopilin PulG
LLEILVVVAIMLIVAAVASPSLIRMMESQKLRKSAELLRSELARTRVVAMKTGRIQMFRYQYDQNGYVAFPWQTAADLVNATDSLQLPGVLPPDPTKIQDDVVYDDTPKNLPEGIRFVGGETVNDMRSLEIDLELQRDLAREMVWSPPILFYPDGSSSDARIVLANNRAQVVEVRLRGVTGLSQLSDLLRPEELQP